MLNFGCQNAVNNNHSVKSLSTGQNQIPRDSIFYFDSFMQKEIDEIKSKTNEYYYAQYSTYFSNKGVHIFLGKSLNGVYHECISFFQTEKGVPQKNRKIFSRKILIENPLTNSTIPLLVSKFSTTISQNKIVDDYLSTANFLPTEMPTCNSIDGCRLVVYKQKGDSIQKLSIDGINKADSIFLEQLIKNINKLNPYFKKFIR